MWWDDFWPKTVSTRWEYLFGGLACGLLTVTIFWVWPKDTKKATNGKKEKPDIETKQ